MLLLILSGQRGQSIHLFDVRNMYLTYSKVIFTIGDTTKTSSARQHSGSFVYLAYVPDRRLCVLTVLKEYLSRTLDIRQGVKNLFLTYNSPHKAATKDTVSRWVKSCMNSAGIDTERFKPHSVRSASTSYAHKANVSLDTIMKSAGWSRVSTFNKYYKMPVSDNFGDALLRAHDN